MALSLRKDKNENGAGSAKPKKTGGLNKQIGGGGKYPSKTSINLLIVEKHAAKNAGSLAIFGVFMVALLIFTKFFVVDKLVEINQKEAEYNQQQNLLNAMIESNQIYEKVRAEYSRFGNSYLNEDERNQQDRMKILKVIEEELLEKDALMDISITENEAELLINSEKLRNVSEIVAELESNPLVEYVTVTNSVTDDSILAWAYYASETNAPVEEAPSAADIVAEAFSENPAETETDASVLAVEGTAAPEETMVPEGESEALESVDASEAMSEEQTESETEHLKIVITKMNIFFRAATEVETESEGSEPMEAETDNF